MKLLRRITLFTGSLVVGVLLGMILRPVLFGEAHNNEPSPVAAVSSERSILTKRSASRASLGTTVANASAVERFLELATRAARASADEMFEILRLAKLHGHPDIERAVATRWATLDPSHMFKTLMASGDDHSALLWRILFQEWALANPREALTEYLASPDAKHDFGRNLDIWSALMRHAPEFGIEASAHFDTNHFSVGMDGVRSWAAADPQAAAAKVVQHLKTDERGEVMKEVGKVWGDSDPEAALRYASTLEGKIQDALYKGAILSWAAKDPEAAAAFAAAEADPVKRAKLGEGLAAGLAKTNPQLALEWAHENLRSASRANAVGDVVRTVAKQDIKAAGELVARMDPGGAMSRAVTEFMSEWGRHADLSENDVMFQWIESLTDTQARKRAIESMAWRFSTYSKTGMLDFVTGEHGHLATDSMIRGAATQRANQDPESAVDWASGLPEDRSAKALAAVEGVLKGMAQH